MRTEVNPDGGSHMTHRQLIGGAEILLGLVLAAQSLALTWYPETFESILQVFGLHSSPSDRWFYPLVACIFFLAGISMLFGKIKSRARFRG